MFLTHLRLTFSMNYTDQLCFETLCWVNHRPLYSYFRGICNEKHASMNQFFNNMFKNRVISDFALFHSHRGETMSHFRDSQTDIFLCRVRNSVFTLLGFFVPRVIYITFDKIKTLKPVDHHLHITVNLTLCIVCKIVEQKTKTRSK